MDYLVLNNVLERSVGLAIVLLMVLTVAGCASTRVGPSVSEGSKTSSNDLVRFRKGMRQNPMLDAYATRYPEQWQANTRTLWPEILKAISGRNPQKDPEASQILSAKMRTSNLMKDVAIAQRDAMANLSEAHATRLNALGVENMTYLRSQSPQACAKLLTSDPSVFGALPDELRSKQQKLFGEMIASTPEEPGKPVDSETIGRLLEQIDKGVRKKYPSYPGWDKLSLATTDSAAQARTCDYSIEQGKIVAQLPASD